MTGVTNSTSDYHLPKGMFSCIVYEEDEVGHVVKQEEGGEEKLEAPEV